MSNTDEEKPVSIIQQVRHIIDEDEELTPEEVVERVLSPYGSKTTDPLCAYVWPALLRVTRNMHSKTSNENVRRNVHRPKPYRDAAEHEDANVSLRRTVFRDTKGGVMYWDDLTIDVLERKIAWIRTHIGTLVDHMNILTRTRDLMVKHSAERLGDIENWPDLLRDQTDDDSDLESAINGTP